MDCLTLNIPSRWWSHDMETFLILLSLCEGNPLVTGGLSPHRASNVSYDAFLPANLSKRLNKQSNCWWFETPWSPFHFTVMIWQDRADSRFACSQWETALLCNDVSHWLVEILESALQDFISQSHKVDRIHANVRNLNENVHRMCCIASIYMIYTVHD